MCPISFETQTLLNSLGVTRAANKHLPRCFLFSCHGDATYMGGDTLGFARPDGGALEVVEQKHLSTLLGSHGMGSEGTL